MSDSFVTTDITGAAFSDGSTLSGSWTAEYDGLGNLVAISNASFVVSGSGGTTIFTDAGTLPYADTAADSSYEIHFLAAPTGGNYTGLYVDWKSEQPSSFYEGSPSLYTSVLNPSSATPTTPLRLVSDGSTASGALPGITGLPATQSGTGGAALPPFSGVAVTAPDAATQVNAIITLGSPGAPSDATGALSGPGLTKTSPGTYSLADTTAATLGTELRGLTFTPTAAPTIVSTAINLYVNDSDGTTAAETVLNVTIACFAQGTLIATDRGAVAVETLDIGDRLVTANGRARPITWIGHRRIDCHRHADPAKVQPVRIDPGAFGLGRPQRALLLSPDHAVFIEGVLIPVKYLINGTTIAPTACASVTYWHVELDQHDVILAEGLPCESYIDTGNRADFAGDDGHAVAPPDLSSLTWEARGCARLVVTGAELAAARRLVNWRGGETMREDWAMAS